MYGFLDGEGLPTVNDEGIVMVGSQVFATHEAIARRLKSTPDLVLSCLESGGCCECFLGGVPVFRIDEARKACDPIMRKLPPTDGPDLLDIDGEHWANMTAIAAML